MTTWTCFFPFCGLGAGALGFLRARVQLRGEELRFRSLGGIDNDPLACEDFEQFTKSPALCADMKRLTPGELRAFAGEVPPDVVFLSPPCKGASGLLSAKAAKQPKYVAMNRLALDWMELMVATWDVPPRLCLLENVPRITSRAKSTLDAVKRILRKAGYVFHEQSHDCGVLGGLAQHRTRYLLVARHADRCPPLLYQPPPQRVRACGEVLGAMPLPEDPAAGPMHRLPRLSWLNWVRLSLIPAGGDWRDLDGVLKDGQPRREVHRRHRVEKWDRPTATVAGSGSNGPSAVADPRASTFGGYLGVKGWDESTGAICGESLPSKRAFAVADPRLSLDACKPNSHHNKYRVEPWGSPAHTVIGATRVGSGAPSVADPRVRVAYDHGYGVLRWVEPSSTIAGGSDVGQGAYSVADIRFKSTYHNGTYGVLDWQTAAGTITGNAQVDCGRFAVADPRKPPPEIRIIIAADGTWHRPLTTLELAALQSLPTVVDGRPLKLAGEATGKHRERIGNAVPPDAARAIAEHMLVCLAAGRDGRWELSGGGSVWVENGADWRSETAIPAIGG